MVIIRKRLNIVQSLELLQSFRGASRAAAGVEREVEGIGLGPLPPVQLRQLSYICGKKKKGWDSIVKEGGKKEWEGEGRKIDKRHADRQTELKRLKEDHLPGI